MQNVVCFGDFLGIILLFEKDIIQIGNHLSR